MKIEYKIFRSILFTAIALPPLFFGWLLLNTEYLEYFIYGDQGYAIVTNTEAYSGSGKGGGGIEYKLKMIDDSTKKYIVKFPLNGGVTYSDHDALVTGSARIGDTVLIKIYRENQAKILRYKGNKVNDSINVWEKLCKWIVIVILFMLSFYLLYMTYKAVKTPITYD